MSIRETSVWASLATTILLYAVFFCATATDAVPAEDQVDLLAGLVFLQIAALVAFEVFLAMRRGSEPVDERDAFIALRSFRIAYFVLGFCVATVTIVYIVWGTAAAAADAMRAGVSPPSVALVGNALLASFVAAEIAKSATQVVLYRRSSGTP